MPFVLRRRSSSHSRRILRTAAAASLHEVPTRIDQCSPTRQISIGTWPRLRLASETGRLDRHSLLEAPAAPQRSAARVGKTRGGWTQREWSQPGGVLVSELCPCPPERTRRRSRSPHHDEYTVRNRVRKPPASFASPACSPTASSLPITSQVQRCDRGVFFSHAAALFSCREETVDTASPLVVVCCSRVTLPPPSPPATCRLSAYTLSPLYGHPSTAAAHSPRR